MTPTEFRDSATLSTTPWREKASRPKTTTPTAGFIGAFFSGEHKSLDLDLQNNPEAQARVDSWFGDDADRPLRRPFDSMYRLGLDDEPSDYDLQILPTRWPRHVANTGRLMARMETWFIGNTGSLTSGYSETCFQLCEIGQ